MFHKDFYPTPYDTIYDLIGDIDWRDIGSMLEPSAGKGDIANYARRKSKYCEIDLIEINQTLQATLKGAGWRVIHDNFLTFNTFDKYDLIAMNPPFSEGDKHLLKAIDMQKRGGKIRCILNAETIKNPYSNTRKELLSKLDKYGADITYKTEAFTGAERKTNVEIAIIKIDIKNNRKDSLIFDSLKNEKEMQGYEFNENNKIMSADPIQAAIENYNFEVKAGLKLIYNYFDLKPMLMRELEDSNTCILNVTIAGDGAVYDTNANIIKRYIKNVRYKYWKALFNTREFNKLLTSQLRDELSARLNELKNYEFSEYNIKQIMYELKLNLNDSIKDTIVELFEMFTSKYAYDQYSSNLHLYNGWKTNQAYKINDKKVIIPLDAYSGGWNAGEIYFGWSVEEKIRDMHMAFEYLEGGRVDSNYNILDILNKAKEENNDFVEFKYFKIKFYKKGTAHIHWKDRELIKKLNIFGAKYKNWLPRDYGTKAYKDMSKREKEVVKEFEGEKEYKDTVSNSEYYLSSLTVDQVMLMG